jgi:hypothetical protein
VQDQIGQHFCPHGEFSVVVNQSNRPEFVNLYENLTPLPDCDSLKKRRDVRDQAPHV